MLVHPALIERLKARQNAPRKLSSAKPRLWASEVGGCLRKAMLRITGHQPTLEFSLKALESMQNGVVYEKDTQEALAAAYAADFAPQVWLGNDIWSCYSDFVLFHKKPNATIIEHKAVGDKWWNYNSDIPKEAHVIQLALYKYLYQTMFGIDPAVILDVNGINVGELRYSAFGETRKTFGSTPTDYRYTGQREEAGIGLYYYNARWYDFYKVVAHS